MLSVIVHAKCKEYITCQVQEYIDTQTGLSRTSLYYNSFLPPAVTERYNLPIECRNSDSVNSLKRSMNKGSIVVSKYFFFWLMNNIVVL